MKKLTLSLMGHFLSIWMGTSRSLLISRITINEKNAPGGIRTHDLRFIRPTLCLLSYGSFVNFLFPFFPKVSSLLSLFSLSPLIIFKCGYLMSQSIILSSTLFLLTRRICSLFLPALFFMFEPITLGLQYGRALQSQASIPGQAPLQNQRIEMGALQRNAALQYPA